MDLARWVFTPRAYTVIEKMLKALENEMLWSSPVHPL
jgi:hypothetical protein